MDRTDISSSDPHKASRGSRYDADTDSWIDNHNKRAKLKKRIAKVRKADGGVAPNYNNPSKIRKKKTATKAASRTKEDPDRIEQIDEFMKNSPLGEKMMEDAVKNPKRFKDQFKEMKGYATKGIKINPSRRSNWKKNR